MSGNIVSYVCVCEWEKRVGEKDKEGDESQNFRTGKDISDQISKWATID